MPYRFLTVNSKTEERSVCGGILSTLMNILIVVLFADYLVIMFTHTDANFQQAHVVNEFAKPTDTFSLEMEDGEPFAVAMLDWGNPDHNWYDDGFSLKAEMYHWSATSFGRFEIDLHVCTDEDKARFNPIDELQKPDFETYGHHFLCPDMNSVP